MVLFWEAWRPNRGEKLAAAGSIHYVEKMPANESVLIFGPDGDFNAALIVELGRRQIHAQISAQDVATLRERARGPSPGMIFLDCQFRTGWGLDLLFALVKLFPKTPIFLCAKDFTLNKAALEEIGVACFMDHDAGLPAVVNHFVACFEHFKSRSTNVS